MSVQVSSPYDGQQFRDPTQGMHSSPHESPRTQRPQSQQSLHIPSAGSFTPSISHLESYQPLSALHGAHQQPIRSFQPNLSIPSPHLNFGQPTSAPPLQGYMNVYDPRGLQELRSMQSTVSQAHPMNSATENTASSRWSSSPDSHTGIQVGPPSATIQPQGYPMHHFQPQSNFNLGYSNHEEGQKHINPMQILPSQSMSRSTSGGSDQADMDGRLMTPVEHQFYQSQISADNQDLRKVSDSLNRGHGIFSSQFIPNFGLADHSLSIAPHPQPEGGAFFGRNGVFNTDFAVSSERNDVKPEIAGQHETEYGRERAAQIAQNKETLVNLGLATQTPVCHISSIIQPK